MPKRGRSGIPNLYKKHTASCRNRDPLKCDCPWYGKYKRVNVATWSRVGHEPDCVRSLSEEDSLAGSHDRATGSLRNNGMDGCVIISPWTPRRC